MKTVNPLVSIITPCYNAEAYLSETIKSVLAQTYNNWEMIIIDDCSSDNSPHIIKEFVQNDKRIRYLKTANKSGSPSLPRNIGIEDANGKYIAFLDADDIWLSNKLEQQIKYMESTGESFTYTDYEKINIWGIRKDRVIHAPLKSSFWDVIETCGIPCLTVMIDRAIIGDCRFKSTQKEDFVFWLDILKKGYVAQNIGIVTALYREQNSSRSSNKLNMITSQWNVLRKIEGVKRIPALYFMTKYLFKGLIKYIK